MGLKLPIYALVNTLPVRVVRVGDEVEVEAWDPETRKLKPAPQYLTVILMGQDEDGPVEVTRMGMDEWHERIKSFDKADDGNKTPRE